MNRQLCLFFSSRITVTECRVALDSCSHMSVVVHVGDLWSYNQDSDSFIVSPEPDVSVHELDCAVHRCVIAASDGVWNMVSAADAVEFVERWMHQRDKLLTLVSTVLSITRS